MAFIEASMLATYLMQLELPSLMEEQNVQLTQNEHEERSRLEDHLRVLNNIGNRIDRAAFVSLF